MDMVFFIPPQHRRLALMAAQADSAPVLIFGASGTGKGKIAKWIHASGPRAGSSFREATKDLPLAQHLPLAQGGTLVIHEIGAWPLAEQMVLLSYLNTKSIPLPSGMRMLANVRIIATTSQNIEGRAQGGLFNPELLAKLNVFRIEMPPLARRLEEFEDIVLGIVEEIARELHKEHLKRVSSEVYKHLRGYDWPGNIRELRNVLKLAVVSARGDSLELADLPEFGHHKLDFHSTREQFEKTYISELLKTFNWEIERTCKLTRMNRATLIEKMNLYGITLPADRPRA